MFHILISLSSKIPFENTSHYPREKSLLELKVDCKILIQFYSHCIKSTIDIQLGQNGIDTTFNCFNLKEKN